MTRSHSASSACVQSTSCTPSSVNASIRSMTENGNSTLVSTKTLVIESDTGSVGKAGGLNRVRDTSATCPPVFAPYLELQHVRKTHHPVLAVRQMF